MSSAGYLENNTRHPGAMAAVVAVHVAGISALIMLAPVVKKAIDKALVMKQIDAPTIPPIIIPDPAPQTKAKIDRPVDQVKPLVEGPPAKSETKLTGTDPGPLTGLGGGEGLGGGDIIIDPPPPVPNPVVVGPRFTGGNAQPPYPPGLQRLNIEGAVTVRVLVGTDGRPVRVELVRADNDGFFTATRDWALKKWRFAPATRDGTPFEEWRAMTVRFEMNAD